LPVGWTAAGADRTQPPGPRLPSPFRSSLPVVRLRMEELAKPPVRTEGVAHQIRTPFRKEGVHPGTGSCIPSPKSPRKGSCPQGDESAGRRAAAFPSLLPPVHAGPESAPRHAFGCEPTRRADGRNECTFLADGRAVPVHDASPGHSPDSDRSH
jgi:hypothetical protein